MNIQHFILTRFNVGLYRGRRRTTSDKRIDPSVWMMHRLRLFRKWCYPSVVHQSVRDWEWIIAVDAATPDGEMNALRDIAVDDRVSLFPTNDRFRVAWGPLLETRVRSETTHVVTTRLDNDDALHETAIETLRRLVDDREDRYFIDLPFGLYVHAEEAVIREVDRTDAYPLGGTQFLSLVERRTASHLLSVFCCLHARAREVAPMVKLKLFSPMTATIVHDMNLRNRMRHWGREISVLPEGFHTAR